MAVAAITALRPTSFSSASASTLFTPRSNSSLRATMFAYEHRVVGREDHQSVLALLGDLERMIGVAEREHDLTRGQRLHDLRTAARHHEVGRPGALLLEELLLRRHQVLAVDERRDAVRGRDGLEPLGLGPADPGAGESGPARRPVRVRNARRVRYVDFIWGGMEIPLSGNVEDASTLDCRGRRVALYMPGSPSVNAGLANESHALGASDWPKHIDGKGVLGYRSLMVGLPSPRTLRPRDPS